MFLAIGCQFPGVQNLCGPMGARGLGPWAHGRMGRVGARTDRWAKGRTGGPGRTGGRTDRWAGGRPDGKKDGGEDVRRSELTDAPVAVAVDVNFASPPLSCLLINVLLASVYCSSYL